jgi:hypothetical protein
LDEKNEEEAYYDSLLHSQEANVTLVIRRNDDEVFLPNEQSPIVSSTLSEFLAPAGFYITSPLLDTDNDVII